LPPQFWDIAPVLIQIGISGAAIYLQVQLNRLISKEIFQRILFKDENDMPTTKWLLWCDDHYDDIIKGKIHKKIASMFDMSLLSPEEESADTQNAKRLIIIAVSQIRNSLRNNFQQVQHNREYGFWRNLAGGSLIAVFASAALLIFAIINCNPTIKTVATIMIVVYGFVIAISPYLIRRSGNYYAKVLFEQFLSLSEKGNIQ
jgi:uncharacterized membrane protein (DUF2068 family)